MPRRRPRRCSGSATRPTAACTCPARSSTTSSSRAAAPRCSPTTSRAVTTAGRRRRVQAQHRHRDRDRRPLLPRSRTARTSATTRRCRRARTSSAGLTAPDWVEHFPFQDGMLVWAVDETYDGQQHHRAPGPRPRAAGGRPAGAVHLRGRHRPAEQPAPAVRRDLRAASDGRRDPPQGGPRRAGGKTRRSKPSTRTRRRAPASRRSTTTPRTPTTRRTTRCRRRCSPATASRSRSPTRTRAGP